jgi:ankyrin repeat protein
MQRVKVFPYLIFKKLTFHVDGQKETAFHLTARGGHLGILEWLWARQKFNSLGTELDTFVTTQSRKRARLPIYHTNLIILDHRQETALHLAGKNGYLEVVTWLIEHQIDVTAKSRPMPGHVFLVLTVS